MRLSPKHSLAMIIAMTMFLATALIFWARRGEELTGSLAAARESAERSSLDAR